MRLLTIGDIASLPKPIQEALEKAKDATRAGMKLALVLALSYGGRDEIVRAARKAAGDIASGNLAFSALDEERFTKYLDTAGVPDPDLIIRTAGEMRLSNFLPWQAAYAEFYATPVLWPDFTVQHLHEAIRNYGTRLRKFGGLVNTK